MSDVGCSLHLLTLLPKFGSSGKAKYSDPGGECDGRHGSGCLTRS